ncbi:MAG: asparaginase [Rhodocyclaceae bacterium]|nr:asparaginase [Rhodocyclaceae bacterium]
MASRILVLHAGGTIGMAPASDGLRPTAGFADRLREALAGRAGDLPAFDLIAPGAAIDSANLRPSHWTAIAEPLIAHWNDYDGFVVLHGTDTLAWTASAMSFLLLGCDKPVIVTGAQIPWQLPRSDAMANVEAALRFAAQATFREVMVCFAGRLLRGNRCQKVDSTAFEAFDSPRLPALATLGIDSRPLTGLALPARPRQFALPRFDDRAVALLMVHPGLTARAVNATLDDPCIRGLILVSYGVGNLPGADEALLASLAGATGRGVVIVNVTQCARGEVAQDTYAAGAALGRIGVVAGCDLTPEAAFAKLHVLLATGVSPDAIRSTFATPLCGELTALG